MMKYKVVYNKNTHENSEEVDADMFEIRISEKGTMSAVFYKTDNTPVAAYNYVSKIVTKEGDER